MSWICSLGRHLSARAPTQKEPATTLAPDSGAPSLQMVTSSNESSDHSLDTLRRRVLSKRPWCPPSIHQDAEGIRKSRTASSCSLRPTLLQSRFAGNNVNSSHLSRSCRITRLEKWRHLSSRSRTSSALRVLIVIDLSVSLTSAFCDLLVLIRTSIPNAYAQLRSRRISWQSWFADSSSS